MEDGDVELIPPSTSMKEINRWMSIKRCGYRNRACCRIDG